MVVRNPVTHDTRVMRHARALVDDGFHVLVVGTRIAGLPNAADQDGVRIVRVEPRGALQWLLTKVMLAPKLVDARLPGGKPDRVRQPFRALYGVTRLALNGPRLALRALAFQRTAAAVMAASRPDVYVCHDLATAWAGRIARMRHRAPVLYDAHEIYEHQHLPNMTRRRRVFVHQVERWITRRADAVITVNDSIADHLAARLGIARPVVIRNVPSAPTAHPVQIDVPDAFTAGTPILLYLGAIATGRGIEPAIRALPTITGARLVCMGPAVPASTRDAFTALAVSLGVGDRVTFVPAAAPEDVVGIAAHATIGLVLIEDVCLSYRLSLPNKLFECMHAGLPVVASDLPEIAGIVTRLGTGVVCDPSSPAAISSAVRTLLDDPERAAVCAANARSAAAGFTWEAETETLLGMYSRLGLRG